MADINKNAAKNILEREEEQARGVRELIAGQMKSLDFGAVLWGENVFGSTNYPLVSVKGGRARNVHGVRLNPDGEVCAIVAYPAGMEVSGVKTLSAKEADKAHLTTTHTGDGTPEEWCILGDCFATAMQVAGAEKRENQPLPWW